MKPRHLRAPLRVAVYAAAMTVAASAAHAWTETKINPNADGSTKFTDPDEKVEKFGGSTVPGQPGSTTFRFEAGPNNGLGGPSSSRFGPTRQFDPAWGPRAFPDGR
jgi:hypothetical protein